MTDSFNNADLDRLLAQPPRLADNGFSDRLHARLRRQQSIRRRVVLALSGFWLVLVVIFGSLSSLRDISAELGNAWVQFIQTLLPAAGDIAIDVPVYSIMLMVFCAGIAIAPLLIKD